jgi:hypothetical protein
MKLNDLSAAMGLTKRFERIVSLRALLTDLKNDRHTVQTVLGDMGDDMPDEASYQIGDILSNELCQVALGYRNKLAALGLAVTQLNVPPPAPRR